MTIENQYSALIVSEEQLQDPLRFIQQLAKEYDVDLKNDYRITNSTKIPQGPYKGNPNLWFFTLTDKNFDPVPELSVSISLYDPSTDMDLFEAPKGLRQFLEGKEKINDKYYSDWDIAQSSVTDFGRYKKNVRFGLSYGRTRNIPGKFKECQSFFSTFFNEDKFKLESPHWDEYKELPVAFISRPLFKDAESATEDDFRPYFRRAFEIFTLAPREQWHDPRVYLGEDSRALESVIDSTLDYLFAGSEKEELKKKIEQARLRMRGSWQSVPRLNLGAIRLPNPGQRDVRADAFVKDALPLFIEYLASINVMDIDKAEELAVRKLTNYYVHQGGFQLNRKKAGDIINGLRSRKELQEAV